MEHQKSFDDVLNIECEEVNNRYECEVIGWDPEGQNPKGKVNVGDLDFPLGSVFTDGNEIIAGPGGKNRKGTSASTIVHAKWDCEVSDDELSCNPYDISLSDYS